MCINGNIEAAPEYIMNTDIHHSYSDHAMILCVHASNLGHKSSGVNDITMEFKYFHLIGEMTSNILRVATEARALTLGPFSPSFKVSFILLLIFPRFKSKKMCEYSSLSGEPDCEGGP